MINKNTLQNYKILYVMLEIEGFLFPERCIVPGLSTK